MIVDFKHFKSFLVLAQTLNFHRAAAELHIAQPALSRQIQQMEESLGYQLFDRTHRQIALTPAGIKLKSQLPALFRQRDRILEEARETAQGERVSLRLGYSSAAMSSFLPAILRSLQAELIHCEFTLVEGTSDNLINQVVQEELDAAFILHRPQNPLLRCIPIKADQTGIIIPSDHPLRQKRRITLSDLRDETLILFPRHTNPVMYDEIIHHCQRAGFSPKRIIETAPRSTAIGLVAAGQGVATISASLKQTCVSGTIFKPLVQPGPMIRYSCIALKKEKGRWLKQIKGVIDAEFPES